MRCDHPKAFKLSSFQLRYIDELIGWGVFARNNLPANSFIAEYVGELITATEKKNRLKGCVPFSTSTEQVTESLGKQQASGTILQSNEIDCALGKRQSDLSHGASRRKRSHSFNEAQNISSPLILTSDSQNGKSSVTSVKQSVNVTTKLHRDAPVDVAAVSIPSEKIVATPYPIHVPHVEPISSTTKRHWYIMDIGNGLAIDSERYGNISRLINHSCNPNCVAQKWKVGAEIR